MHGLSDRNKSGGGRLGRAAAVALACGACVSLAAAQPVRVGGDDRPGTITRPGVDLGERAQPAEDGPEAVVSEDTVSLAAFSEAVELQTLVNLVAEALEINIVIKGSSLAGSVMFNAPVAVPKDELLLLLDSLLEQWDYTITMTDFGLYTIVPIGETKSRIGSTTRILSTPNIKPSLLTPAVQALGGNLGQVQYLDELGVIVATGSPMQLGRLEDLLDAIQDRYHEMVYVRIELDYIAAQAAKERALGLVGGAGGEAGGISQQLRQIQQQQGGQGATPGIAGPSLDNLGDRLTIDFQGNALIFRGTPDELETVQEVVDLIDVPNTLTPKQYFAGSAALQIADIASQRGLGEVKVLESTTNQNDPFNFQAQQRQLLQSGLQDSDAPLGGPVMVVDPQRQSIIYYGTESQHEQLAALMEELRTEDDRIVIRQYKLQHADAEAVSDLIIGLISGQSTTGDAPLLPTGQAQQRNFIQNAGVFGGGGDDEIGAFDPNKVFVIADVPNNQVVVKAPLKQQDEFSRLIERLDLKRPQVFIEATIVSVSDNTDFRLAVETQVLSGQFGFQTNYGLTSAGDDFQDSRNVLTGLGGLTTGWIKSQYVPIVLNAIQTDTDSRILSSPSLLVNDNEEARIVSVEQQPTTTTSQGDATTQTSFQGFEDAGTTLEVTPSISEGGFLRLDYVVELSNFTGQGANGIPAPRQERTVEGQVTIPSDATIVVGGIRVDDVRDTIVKVPLLGDIPIIKHAFRDTRKINNSSTLYVFITPRIMTDPNFYDLKLLTEGPQAEMEVEDDSPKLEPIRIETVDARYAGPSSGVDERVTPAPGWAETRGAPGGAEPVDDEAPVAPVELIEN